MAYIKERQKKYQAWLAWLTGADDRASVDEAVGNGGNRKEHRGKEGEAERERVRERGPQ